MSHIYTLKGRINNIGVEVDFYVNTNSVDVIEYWYDSDDYIEEQFNTISKEKARQLYKELVAKGLRA